MTGDPPADGTSLAGGQPVAQWAWLPIAAMTVPLVLVLIVVLL